MQKSPTTSATISIDPALYESLRQHCDSNGIRFADFVADALENAVAEEEILQKTEKVERLIQQMDRLRWTSFRRGFRQGFAAGVLAGQGRIGLSQTLTPAEVTHKTKPLKSSPADSWAFSIKQLQIPDFL